ncbi:hypothetical protein PAMC26577_34125 [Caballeronia sordidicola]|uniref:Uncharacterized protein n=1 Tax=Caballeronia sordidicola TaxID=196367 RepID=A0A242MAY2_CABSO|nr:hypothetical protein PAMC26577_34125 [Caballeronia sordidicola]
MSMNGIDDISMQVINGRVRKRREVRSGHCVFLQNEGAGGKSDVVSGAGWDLNPGEGY